MSSCHAIFLSACLAAAVVLPAQTNWLPNVGCPGASYPAVTALPPGLGLTLTYGWRSSTNDTPVLMIGSLLQPPVVLPGTITCPGVPCSLAVQPFFLVAGAPSSFLLVDLTIPNNPALVGLTYGVQGADVGTQVPCVFLSKGLAVTISR